MFDFDNKQAPEYIAFTNFVNVETNQPKKISEIQEKQFPFKIVEDIQDPKIFIKENLLTEEECEYLVWMSETVISWPKATQSFWDERNFGFLTDLPKHHYAGVETAKLILSIHSRIKEFISSSFGTECYADQIGIVRWPPGSYQMPHIDNVPELDRVSGCVLYLNDDYEGGETFYPYYNKIISPKAGTIFAHDSGHSHLHGVTQIKTKTRYTISSTWTDNPYQSAYERQLVFTQNYLNTVDAK